MKDLMRRVDNLYLWSEIQCAEGRPEQEAAVPNGSLCSRVWEQSPATVYKLACQRLWLSLIKEGAQELDICVWRTWDHQATPLSEPPNRREWLQPLLPVQQLVEPSFALVSVTSCHLIACSAVCGTLPEKPVVMSSKVVKQQGQSRYRESYCLTVERV